MNCGATCGKRKTLIKVEHQPDCFPKAESTSSAKAANSQLNTMVTSSPMVSTVPNSLRDGADYLPLEAQALRRCIAEIYEECFSLSKKAEAESRRKDRDLPEGKKIWDLIDLYRDDIRGYAQLRVPIAYPSEAVPHLRRCALFELPGVLDWFLKEGQDRPYVRHYLETVDYLRLQVLDYIQRFDQLTIDQKTL